MKFSQATAVKQQSSHEYLAEFPDDWCIGTGECPGHNNVPTRRSLFSVPHGGFVTACFLQVATAHFKSTLSSQNHPHTITLHLNFLRRTQTGPALFTVQDTKLGRQTSIIHVSLSQPESNNAKPPFAAADLREEVVGYITNSNIAAETGVTFDTGYKLSPPAPPVDLSLLRQDKDKNWARQGAMPFASFRKASQKVQFHFPRNGQIIRNIGDEWLCFSNGEKFTNESLGYLADVFPIPVEQFREDKNPYDVPPSGAQSARPKPARYWYPTLVLNLDIKKALPVESVEWLFVRVRTKQIKNGRMDLDIIIIDEGGDIVALSNHVCLVLGSERNTAARRHDTSKI
jgi:hypothetical protein